MRNLLRNPLMLIFLAILLMMVVESGGIIPFFYSLIDRVMGIVYMIPGLVIGLSFHEFAHAKVAVMCGDDTPRLQGRVTINPVAHIDPVGLFALIFIGFGWGKAVQINPNNFKNTRRDEILVGIAGVTMNLIIAVLVTLLMTVMVYFTGFGFLASDFGSIVFDIFMYIIQINLVLMIFNLIPVPPLDGFNVLFNVLNLRNKPIYYQVYQWGWLILMLMLMLGVTGLILRPILNFLLGIAYRIILSPLYF